MRSIGIPIIIMLLFSALLIPLGTGSGENYISSGYYGPFTLPHIKAYDWSNWDQDVDGNQVDDLIQGDWSDLDNREGRIGINVHLALPVTSSDLELIHHFYQRAGLDPIVHGVGRYSTAVYLSVSTNGDHDDLPVLPWVTMIEYRPIMVNMLDISSPATRSRGSSDYTPMTASDLGYTGQGLVVAVIDSGVDNSIHESLRGKYVYGVDFTGTTSIPGLDPDDIDGHGTHVAGTVMGTGGTTERYKGTAPDAQLVDLRYARVQGDFTGAADRALEWVIENHEEFGIRVVSCSWGSTVFTSGRDTTSRLVNQLVDDGVVVVVAAGNDGSQGMSSPAAADNALTVGALHDHSTIDRDDDTYDGYSNYGPRSSDGDLDNEDELKPDLISPGRNIRAPKHNSVIDYVDKTGTSMATPHVSGIVALMLEANPDLTPRDVKLIIRDTAQQRYDASRMDLDPKYNYRTGWGDIDAYGAVKRAQDLLDFGLAVPDEVRLNDPFDMVFAGQFTKTPYDVQSDEMIMEIRTPGDWGMPTDIDVDPDSSFVDTDVTGPFLLGTEWVIRARLTYNLSIEEATPRIFTRVRPIGRIGETRTFKAAVSINGISGNVESMNATIIHDSLPPDLSVTPLSIWISESRPEGGDRITITARINNTGSADVENAAVRFIDGPQRTGTIIGEDIIDVPSQSYGIAEVEWEANPGLHAITVIADPDDEIDESNEDNNTAERPVSVIGVNPPPIAQLEVTPITGTTITEFTFDGSGSTDTNFRGGVVVSFNFDFGDGSSTDWVNEPVVTHIYPTGGSYTASLKVKDNGGEESTNTDEVDINVTGVSSEEFDLFFNGSLGLSNLPGPSVPYMIQHSLAPVEIGTWVSERMESSIILHSAVMLDIVLSSQEPSSIEFKIELITESGDETYNRLVYHPGGTENISFDLTLELDELEVKYQDVISIRISGGSNNTSPFMWAGGGGSTAGFLFYYSLNQVPEVDAGEDQDVKAGTEVMFSGMASDLDGEIVGVRWDVDSDGEWDHEATSDLDFEYPGYSVEGQYTVRLEVVDDDGYWIHDTLKVLVRSSSYNYPPVVYITCPSGPLKGSAKVQGTAQDEDGVKRVEVRLEDGGVYGDWSEARGEEDWTFEINTRTLENGIFTLFARAYDGDRYSEAASCEIEIENPNTPPEITRVLAVPGPFPIDGMTYLLLKADVYDADLPGDSLSVYADLTEIGGPGEVVMRDDGKAPDPVEDDNEFTLEFLPPVQTASGIYDVIFTVMDRYGAFATEKAEVEVVSQTECHFKISDDEVENGENLFIELRVESRIPVGEVLFISEMVNDDGRIELKDDGRNGDRVAGDSIYSRNIEVDAIPGMYNYSVKVTCTSGTELYLTRGQIEVMRDVTGGPEDNEILIITMVIVGIVMIVMVVLFGLMYLSRGVGVKPTPYYQEVFVQSNNIYPGFEPPVEAVIVLETSDQSSIQS